MGMARIYWDRGNYAQVERIFRQSAEFASEHQTWKLNVAHTFFMQEGKYREVRRQARAAHAMRMRGPLCAVPRWCWFSAGRTRHATSSTRHGSWLQALACFFGMPVAAIDVMFPASRTLCVLTLRSSARCASQYHSVAGYPILRAHRQQEQEEVAAGGDANRAGQPLRGIYHDNAQRGGGRHHAKVRGQRCYGASVYDHDQFANAAKHG